MNFKCISNAKLSLVLQKPAEEGILMNVFLCYLCPKQEALRPALEENLVATDFKANSYLSDII